MANAAYVGKPRCSVHATTKERKMINRGAHHGVEQQQSRKLKGSTKHAAAPATQGKGKDEPTPPQTTQMFGGPPPPQPKPDAAKTGKPDYDKLVKQILVKHTSAVDVKSKVNQHWNNLKEYYRTLCAHYKEEPILEGTVMAEEQWKHIQQQVQGQETGKGMEK